MSMVFVFKTSVKTEQEVQQLALSLDTMREISKWNFDLQDRDRILRIEAERLDIAKIGNAVGLLGFSCEELSDD